MSQHAKLSPSSAKRWMNCPGSANLIGADYENNAGPAAWLGTAAHKVIETMLIAGHVDASEYHGYQVIVYTPGTEETVIVAPGEVIPPACLKANWQLFVCDDDMVRGVQMMIDEVERWKDELFAPELFTERFLDGSWLDPRLGGTADVTLVEPGAWIHLFDYKNGRVIVEVKDNEQMKNYGVFLLHLYPDAAGVVVHLVQPNAIHEDGFIRDESYTADELKLFEITLKAAADATTPPNAPRRAGDHCTYCPAKDRCPEFDALMLNEAAVDFAADADEVGEIARPELADDATPADADEYRANLARRAKWIPLMDQAARDIKKKIFNELMNNNVVSDGTPNGTFKLVQGRSNRVYVDEAQAHEHFNEHGITDEHLFTPPELKSPAQVEKLGRTIGMKPAALKKIVAEVVTKPPGKISVAISTDEREAIDPTAFAGEDFADDPVEDFAP